MWQFKKKKKIKRQIFDMEILPSTGFSGTHLEASLVH